MDLFQFRGIVRKVRKKMAFVLSRKPFLTLGATMLRIDAKITIKK